jgi:cytochrome c5
MVDQQKNSFKFVMYAAIAFAALIVAVLVASLVRGGSALPAGDDAEVNARIRPVANFVAASASVDENRREEPSSESGQTEDNETKNAGDVATEVSSVPDSGTEETDVAAIYASVCFTCHETGLMGAPKKGDKAAWAPRIAAGEESLYHSALNGKGAMPPKGGKPQLSDNEIKAVVDYFVSLAR